MTTLTSRWKQFGLEAGLRSSPHDRINSLFHFRNQWGQKPAERHIPNAGVVVGTCQPRILYWAKLHYSATERNKVLIYVTTWMKLMLSERSQTLIILYIIIYIIIYIYFRLQFCFNELIMVLKKHTWNKSPHCNFDEKWWSIFHKYISFLMSWR